MRENAQLLPLRLEPDARLLVVLLRSADFAPADTSSYLKRTLTDVLRQYHAAVDEVLIPHQPSDADIGGICQQVQDYDLAIVGTINASAQPGQAAMVNALLETGAPMITLGLRLRYDLVHYQTALVYICTHNMLPPSMGEPAQCLWG